MKIAADVVTNRVNAHSNIFDNNTFKKAMVNSVTYSQKIDNKRIKADRSAIDSSRGR